MTTRVCFSLFPTAIGPCGLAWRGNRLVGVQLPERDEAATRARMRSRFPEGSETEPPPAIRHAIDGMTALMAGESRDFSEIALDMDHLSSFERCVYEVTMRIPVGGTLTYGEVAARCGQPGAAQAVGRALGHNPFPIIVPCHRVLAAGGRIGGFSANGGIDTKRRILAIESRHARAEPTLFDHLAGE